MDKYYKIILSCREVAALAKPGQFVMVRAGDNYDPLLRRPLGVHNVKSKQITLLYEIVGKGTGILSQRKAGEYLDVIGPLGNGFNYRVQGTGYRVQILVAGGMGVAPLAFLAERLAYSVERIAYSKNKRSKLSAKRYPLILIGAKTKSHLLCEKEFKEFGCEVKVSTDDGSKGFKGRATDLLKIILTNQRTNEPTNQRIYACGPKSMLEEVTQVSNKYSVNAQVSLEAHMACGIGACLGCVVNTVDGYKRVCKEGPVFNAQEIVW